MLRVKASRRIVITKDGRSSLILTLRKAFPDIHSFSLYRLELCLLPLLMALSQAHFEEN